MVGVIQDYVPLICLVISVIFVGLLYNGKTKYDKYSENYENLKSSMNGIYENYRNKVIWKSLSEYVDFVHAEIIKRKQQQILEYSGNVISLDDVIGILTKPDLGPADVIYRNIADKRINSQVEGYETNIKESFKIYDQINSARIECLNNSENVAKRLFRIIGYLGIIISLTLIILYFNIENIFIISVIPFFIYLIILEFIFIYLNNQELLKAKNEFNKFYEKYPPNQVS